MPGEIVVEKIPTKTIENPSNPEGRDLVSENKTESFLVKSSPDDLSGKKIEKIREIKAPISPQAKSWQAKRALEIDSILSEGLSDIFLKMDVKQQSVFKKTGEETVVKINELLSETKLKVNKIIDLIRRWLKLIPGINKFFLEQEAKIKTDKIIKIKNNF